MRTHDPNHKTGSIQHALLPEKDYSHGHKQLAQKIWWSLDTFFTARLYAKRVYAVVVCLSVCLSVCVCVCVSVILRYCIKTAKRRITPHDSPMTLIVFWCQRSWWNSNGITPYGGDKGRWGGLKLVTFDKKRAITRKRYKIVSIKVE